MDRFAFGTLVPPVGGGWPCRASGTAPCRTFEPATTNDPAPIGYRR